LFSLLVLIGLLSAVTLVLAQDEPAATEEALPEGVVPIPTASAPEAATPEFGDTLPILASARADLQMLVVEQLGGSLPPGWNGSLDINDPSLPLLIRLDLELLAGTLLGASVRPPGWFGPIPSTPFAFARDVRHDLEMLADRVNGPGVRPAGWGGDNPIYSCNRATQTLITFLQLGGVFSLTADPTQPDFCTKAEIETTLFAEINLLANPTAGGITLTTPTQSGPHAINNDFAVGFLDRGASLRVGVVPNGSGITPLGRSYATFSNMMLIAGDSFTVFVDYQFTNITEDEFKDLPDVDTLEETAFCGAEWCAAAG
jgi:hypothetical protein